MGVEAIEQVADSDDEYVDFEVVVSLDTANWLCKRDSVESKEEVGECSAASEAVHTSTTQAFWPDLVV